MHEHAPEAETSGPQPGPDPRRWRALALLGAAFFMIILDGTIVLTAIPAIQSDLSMTTSGVQWVITAYVVAFGGLMLLGGRSADMLGRRKVFLVGTVLFGSSSLLCGLAWAGPVLIGARLVQGVSAAIMAPTALSLVITIFTDPAERNKALGVWGGLGGTGATAGLLLGGVVTQYLGWSWIFFVNVPAAIAVILLVPVLVPRGPDRDPARSYDAAGAVTITLALLSLVYAIVRAPDQGWASPETLGLFVAATMLIVVFVVVESRSVAPLVPLRIFRNRFLIGGNLVIFSAGLAVDGMLFPLTLFSQQMLGYTALQYGLASIAMTATSIAGAMIGEALVTRVGLRGVAATAVLLVAAGCVLLTQVTADASYWKDLVWGLLVFGPGMGAAFVASQIAAFDGVRDEEYGLAAALVDTSFNIGTALGIVITTSVAVAVTSDAVSGAEGGPSIYGYQAAFATSAVFAALGVVAALMLLGRRPDKLESQGPAQETTTEDR
ncbi:MFS transporter [Kribbella sancticallisti]|uniref:MFS transporter n=1 Tax=Kribbella sancticallisti TaxID=460087 RepID=A0ABP4QWS9_9ACTN